MNLTKREREFLTLSALPVNEVANRMGISKATVFSHLANISYKFPEHPNKFCILLEAVKQGVITLDEIVTE